MMAKKLITERIIASAKDTNHIKAVDMIVISLENLLDLESE